MGLLACAGTLTMPLLRHGIRAETVMAHRFALQWHTGLHCSGTLVHIVMAQMQTLKAIIPAMVVCRRRR